ncbi:MAG: S-layer homology domain-containing protein [Oscillospiraceae bacterium]|nr:S-layer homology domain-containing protein [Oscillospiraceae bacterium]
MKRKVTRTLALLLMLCMLLPQTALAATTYYIDVSITGPDAAGVERTVSGTSSRYGTLATPLAAEVVTLIHDKYGDLETVYAGTGLREVVDTGAAAFQSGEPSAWDDYVDTYYDSVSNAFKDTLKDKTSTFGDLKVNQANQVTYTTEGRLYTVTITLKAYTTGSGSSGSGTSGKPPAGQYEVVVASEDRGTLEVDRQSSPAGEQVTITGITPENGYILADIIVEDDDGNPVALTLLEDGTYIFTMPESDVSIETVLVADPAVTGIAGRLNTDGKLAYMQGKADGNFYPASPVTRGQVATIFYRLLNDRSVAVQSTFDDVPAGSWCADAVNTLAALGIVKGLDSHTFAPNRPITRAQFVTICTRFAKITAEGERFTDVPETHWAYGAISTASGLGWVNGTGSGLFAPDRAITRAETAVIMNRVLGRSMAGKSYETARKYLDVPETYWAWQNICEASDGVIPQ